MRIKSFCSVLLIFSLLTALVLGSGCRKEEAGAEAPQQESTDAPETESAIETLPLPTDPPVETVLLTDPPSPAALFRQYAGGKISFMHTSGDYQEGTLGTFCARILDFDQDGTEDLVTGSLVRGSDGAPTLALDLYKISGSAVAHVDTLVTNHELGGSTVYTKTLCGTVENNAIKIYFTSAAYGGSSISESYDVIAVTGSRLQLTRNFTLYEFYRHNTYEYRENVTGTVYADSDAFQRAVNAEFLPSAHYHTGFDPKVDHHSNYGEFAGNHLFTIIDDSGFNFSAPVHFVHSNANDLA